MSKDNEGVSFEELLKGISHSNYPPKKETLASMFEARLFELDVTKTDVTNILGVESRALKGILSGAQKRTDYTALLKLASFLKAPISKVVELYLEAMQENFPLEELRAADRVKFIKDNFDLAALRKVGFINSINDFDEVQSKVCRLFGLKSIFDYKRPGTNVAFSSGIIVPKNDDNRALWLACCRDILREIANPYPYDRDALIKYFAQIRWNTMDVTHGFTNVIKDLYKLGVTVIVQSKLPGTHLRGATIPIYDKPCIAICDYRGFYPTLWFGLLHELYHVIFDWDKIKVSEYHYSEDEGERTESVRESEQKADYFAREYLLPRDKTDEIKPSINNDTRVREFAKLNHIHPSFVYVFVANDANKNDKFAWPRAVKHNPPIEPIIEPLQNNWNNFLPIADFVKPLKIKLYK
jgi:hypothetical protein